jgi:hypothetical protein
MKPLEFSAVFVLESLPPEDSLTGSSLFYDIIRPRMLQKGLESQCKLISVKSKDEFIRAMDELKNKIIYELIIPIIHLEMHGSKDGLQFTNGEFVSWKELQDRLIEMNTLCQNNLFITLATCFGGYIYTVISPRLRSPFWGFVGPFEIISEGEALANFTAFYDEFLLSYDLNEAIRALHNSNDSQVSKFILQNTEYVFSKAYENYEKKYLTPAIVDHRINLVAAECKHLPEFKDWTEDRIKLEARRIIVDKNSEIKKNMMTRFFLWDLFPHHDTH